MVRELAHGIGRQRIRMEATSIICNQYEIFSTTDACVTAVLEAGDEQTQPLMTFSAATGR